MHRRYTIINFQKRKGIVGSAVVVILQPLCVSNLLSIRDTFSCHHSNYMQTLINSQRARARVWCMHMRTKRLTIGFCDTPRVLHSVLDSMSRSVSYQTLQKYIL